MGRADAKDLRVIAPTIPPEIVEEVLFLGHAEEIAARLHHYAAAGLEYIVLGNLSGIVDGAAEYENAYRTSSSS